MIQAAGYYLVIPFIYFISILPFPLLYMISDIFYLLIFHVIGYRRKVVFTNLKNSFPDKPEKELRKLEKKFYHYLCDLFLETFKTLSISKKSMLAHCNLSTDAKKIFDDLASENKNCIIVMGHFGNWEWGGNAFSLNCQQQLYVIYHPLANTYFNDLIIRMRKRFGTDLIPMKDTFKDMLNKRKELNTTAFIADQTPSPEKAYWTKFLNQDTPVFQGAEKISQKLDYPVVYVSINRLDRGYYQLHAELLFADPKSTSENEILETFTRRLEKDIIRQPEIWVWSHRRWKYKRP